jgi:hypothetical protein
MTKAVTPSKSLKIGTFGKGGTSLERGLATATPSAQRRSFNAFTAIPDCDRARVYLSGAVARAKICFNAFTAIPDCDTRPPGLSGSGPGKLRVSMPSRPFLIATAAIEGRFIGGEVYTVRSFNAFTAIPDCDKRVRRLR